MLYAEGTSTGKGFLTHADKDDRGVYIELWGNIIVLKNGAEWWLARNGLTAISKATAQGLYDTFMDVAIAAFNSYPSYNKPTDAVQIPTPTRQALP